MLMKIFNSYFSSKANTINYLIAHRALTITTPFCKVHDNSHRSRTNGKSGFLLPSPITTYYYYC